MKNDQPFVLQRRGDRILLQFEGEEEPVAVRVFRARPVTARGSHISFLAADRKKEVALIPSLTVLDAASQAIAREALAQRYLIPVVTRVLKTDALFGNRYWEIETDRGPRRFLMRSPDTNAQWLTEDRIILRDTIGNCYEIVSLSALDPVSRLLAEKVL